MAIVELLCDFTIENSAFSVENGKLKLVDIVPDIETKQEDQTMILAPHIHLNTPHIYFTLLQSVQQPE